MSPVLGTDDGTTGYGVEGSSPSKIGVRGTSQSSVGVWGQVGTSREPVIPRPGTTPHAGVVGYGYDIGESTPAGVYGRSGGDGVYGVGSNGVHGSTTPGSRHPQRKPAGVWGDSADGNGVLGSSEAWNGVEGDSWHGRFKIMM